MAGIVLAAVAAIVVLLSFLAWRRYLDIASSPSGGATDTCPYSVTETFGEAHLRNVPHQRGVRWLTDVFGRSAERFPDHVALQVPHTGEVLTFAELDREACKIAAKVLEFLDGPDQVVAIAMRQDNAQAVACHLGILKAGGCVVFLDLDLPDAQLDHTLADAAPVVVLTRGQGEIGEDGFRGRPAVDVLALEDAPHRVTRPEWMDDPAERLATIFYTSGTTGKPKGVECHHAGYVNLALSYADYFDLVAGIDATTLTSSLGYDGSISEMYSAWVAGCAVVMLTKEQVRSGPDLVPVLRDAEVTVLFCPPVLLTTLTPLPERDLPYPICRYIVPAGEAFPAALVEPWTRARRQVINTYGPTEASTDTSRQSLRPGQPVTIGSPLANVTHAILEPGTLMPLPLGQTGELCIGGVHVARGYRNLPDQTAEKFIRHPEFGRLYRTGDRCRIDPVTGQAEFLGRIDTQLKVRGHRVEVQAVEDVLQQQVPEIETAVLDYQNEELVAFILAPALGPDGSREVAQLDPEAALRITELLSRQLPEPSVPGRFFLVRGFVLNPRSGKIERSMLPRITGQALEAAETAGSDTAVTAPTVTHRKNGEDTHVPEDDEALSICRSLIGPSLGWDDAFADHGGHSILIARLAQRLRSAGWPISVSALLSECDTARKIAERPKQRHTPVPVTRSPSSENVESDEAATHVLSVSAFTLRQILILAVLYAPHLVGLLAVVAYGDVGSFFLTTGYSGFIAVGFLLYLAGLALPFAMLCWVLLVRFVLAPFSVAEMPTPGRYPKWSHMHLRVWCTGRLQSLVLGPLFAIFRSPRLTAFMLRRLGATVGRDTECANGVQFNGPLALLSIGDEAAIQASAQIQMVRWTGQTLEVGRVRLGRGCKIGMQASVGHGVVVGDGAWVTPLTPVLSDVGPGEICEGAPARTVGLCTWLERPAQHVRSSLPPWCEEVVNITMQSLLDFALLVAPASTVIWGTRFLFPGDTGDVSENYFLTAPLIDVVGHMMLFAFTTTWAGLLLSSVLACLFLRTTRADPGLHSSRSPAGALLLYRQRLMDQIQNIWTWTIIGQYLRALAGMKFSRVGGSECDVMLNLLPDAATADAKVFWAHGCHTNMLDQEAGRLILRQLDMPANFFAGNNCVAEDGHFPTNFLLGVSSPGTGVAFRRQMHSRLGPSITVAGNPPVRFASADFEEERRNQVLPGFRLFFGRVVLNDIFSIGFLRTADIGAYILWYMVLLRIGADYLTGALYALVLTEITLVAACIGIKKMLVGRSWGRDHATPFWSWQHFTYFLAQDCFFAWCRVPFRMSAGTVLANPMLRWMGCGIGARALVMSPLQASDWNAVKIGDDAVVDGMLQYHSLENMTLTVKEAWIGDGAAVNSGATVMGGAVIGPDTTLMPNSLVLKEMQLSGGEFWGSPAEPAGEGAGIDGPDVRSALAADHPE